MCSAQLGRDLAMPHLWNPNLDSHEIRGRFEKMATAHRKRTKGVPKG